MAKRVNKKFLIILTSLILIAGVAALASRTFKFIQRDAATYIARGDGLAAEGKWDEALGEYGKAHNANKKDPVALVKIGDCFMELSGRDPDNVAQARGSWVSALEREPKHVPALKRL